MSKNIADYFNLIITILYLLLIKKKMFLSIYCTRVKLDYYLFRKKKAEFYFIIYKYFITCDKGILLYW
jgi:hypothetical protein